MVAPLKQLLRMSCFYLFIIIIIIIIVIIISGARMRDDEMTS